MIERLRVEQDVAISQVIEHMRCCRDQIIPSVVSMELFEPCPANPDSLGFNNNIDPG